MKKDIDKGYDRASGEYIREVMAYMRECQAKDCIQCRKVARARQEEVCEVCELGELTAIKVQAG